MSRLSELINLNLSESTEKIIAEYIWIGGSGLDLRSKAKTLPLPVADPAKLPTWNYDGSRSDEAPGDDSEVTLKPQAIFKDPFRRGNNIIVICDAYTPAGEPLPTNKRVPAVKIFSHPDVVDEEPWYGINQEYTLLPRDVIEPLGGFPGVQVPHYTGRDIAEAHYKACLYAGINVSGINGEVVPGQWEFKPSVGIAAGDQVWAARYILQRITEKAGPVVSFDPKPPLGDLIGARARTSYSTKSMRAEGSYEATKKVIEKLRLRHKEHIEAYGTADSPTFSWGLANCENFIEDRRPAADTDPYVITSMIAETAIIWKPSLLEKVKSVAKKCICNY